jgi:CBS domain-containing protein
MRTIEDVMNTTVITATASERLGSVRERMVHAGIECVPVLESGEVCGIVTVTDMMESWDLEQTVSTAMATPVITLGPSATTVQAAKAMLHNRMHHLVQLCGCFQSVEGRFDAVGDHIEVGKGVAIGM